MMFFATEATTEALRWIASFLLMYPEIHYVFKYFPFSRYRRREPEILTDAPYRVNPGQRIPLLLLIKDAHQFPVRLHALDVTCAMGNQTSTLHVPIDSIISERMWSRTWMMDPPAGVSGQTAAIQADITYSIRGRLRTATNHNLPQIGHDPLQTYVAADRLPSPPDWIYGDVHYHSAFTADQVEFGAPLPDTVEAARAMGLHFFAVTDHSYDLDDREDNYLVNDPRIPKWHRLHEEIRQLNDLHDDFVILPGEEVTCSNAEGRNVHCLVLNSDSYLPGSGDSAEKWFQTGSELSIPEVLHRMGKSAIAIASHPKDPAPLLERLLIRRGSWSHQDCLASGLIGLQILNGADNDAFREGIQQWKNQLSAGHRIHIYAGNDAHGNFNRYRQVSTPMWRLVERDHYQRFGWAKTCVRVPDLSVGSVVKSLRNGYAMITTGPFLNLEVGNDDGEWFGIGESVRGNVCAIRLDARSTDEFGLQLDFDVFHGKPGCTEATLVSEKKINGNILHSFPIQVREGYVRAEMKTQLGHFCYTNPVWL